MGFFETICECPPPVSYDDLPVKPNVKEIKHPLDKLGYQTKCCGCISLRAGVILICIMSFVWALYELGTADKFIGTMFPKRGDAFKVFKIIYILWSIAFLIACGILMLGIIIRRHDLLNIFVWVAFVFLCANVVINVTAILVVVFRTGDMTRKQAMMAVMSVMWTSLFLYYVIVVNSYKLTLWYILTT